MKSYELLTGERIDAAAFDQREEDFIRKLSADAESGADYFDLLKRVKGPDAFPLRGGRITAAVARSPLYRIAHDVADRVGIVQGYLLDPKVDRSVVQPNAELLSLTEAAGLIGITRPAAHQALAEKRLVGQRVGNAWVVRRSDVETFMRARSARPSGGTTSEGARAELRSK
jgi:excisionase family DNA binding protein